MCQKKKNKQALLKSKSCVPVSGKFIAKGSFTVNAIIVFGSENVQQLKIQITCLERFMWKGLGI